MEYIVYKTTHIPTGQFYIGQHKENGDDYLGSGIRIRNLTAKYPRDQFIRETLHSFSSLSESRQKEIEIINHDLLSNPLCLNLSLGGKGYTSGQKFSFEHKSKIGTTNRLLYAQKIGFEDVEEMTRFVLYALSDGMTPNKIRQEFGIQGRCFDDIISTVDPVFLKENRKKAVRRTPISQIHKECISRARRGSKLTPEHIQKRLDSLRASGNLKKARRKVFLTKIGFDTEEEFLTAMKELKDTGWGITKIAKHFGIDYITAKKRFDTV